MIILKAENISKQYRLGLVGTGTLSDDLKRWWYRVRGKEDPFLKIGDTNDRSTKGDSDYVWALQDINFEVQQGEVLGIIGKNGAGKSTLLKILSRVTAPTTGEIKTRGRIASLLEVGTGFHPELTGRENIYLNGAILGMTKAEIKEKEDEIIAFSGCERYVDTPVKRYSSGMRVRLAFAVAAFLEPDILVIDEVLAVGDAEFQKKAIGKMQDISQGEGRTVLFVSHNMESIQQLCTRAIVLKNGFITFDGEVNQAIHTYLDNDQNEKNIKGFPLILKDIKIKSFEIQNSNGDNVSSFILGMPYRFTLNLINGQTSKIINIRLQFFDTKENLITTFNTFFTNNQQLINPQEEVIATCSINKFSLGPGDYKIGIQIIDLKLMTTLFDEENFELVSVVNGDFYNSGKIPVKKNLGKVFIDTSWDFKKMESDKII
ncbi:ABC transporter ATP-binding protein [Paucihalobacter ruber]|uniref:ABC transporter ATP-binding protein n=1 Tax=Paucihalobacter ruber TaxID=2567861 RepID=A0A506PL77_9FLAO|nr:ABC transporter ATP-binding protein [Paucihalobacter ruber]TPV33867.1 ABC transporter ATP-binding protein [Paucihalobacter ruber]